MSTTKKLITVILISGASCAIIAFGLQQYFTVWAPKPTQVSWFEIYNSQKTIQLNEDFCLRPGQTAHLDDKDIAITLNSFKVKSCVDWDNVSGSNCQDSYLPEYAVTAGDQNFTSPYQLPYMVSVGELSAGIAPFYQCLKLTTYANDCDTLPAGDQDDCLNRYAQKAWQPEACNQIVNVELRDGCLENTARNLADKSVCALVTTPVAYCK